MLVFMQFSKRMQFNVKMSKQFGKTLILNMVGRPNNCSVVQPTIRENRWLWDTKRFPGVSLLAILFRMRVKIIQTFLKFRRLCYFLKT